MWVRRLGPKGLARATRLGGWIAAARRVFGMPDYGAYLAHLRACHPDQPLPNEREYFDLYVKSRYGDGPTRCC